MLPEILIKITLKKKIDIERNDSAKNGSNKNELDINQSIGLHNSGIDT